VGHFLDTGLGGDQPEAERADQVAGRALRASGRFSRSTNTAPRRSRTTTGSSVTRQQYGPL
jgi:hypothetical protein